MSTKSGTRTKSAKHTASASAPKKRTLTVPALRRLLTGPFPGALPEPRHARVREGFGTTREASPAMEFSTLSVRRVDKDVVDRLRTTLARDGRVPPLWEVVGRIAAAGRALLDE